MRWSAALIAFAVLAVAGARTLAGQSGVPFTVRSARSGAWSNPATWAENRVPRAGDTVQVRAWHEVFYDVDSAQAIRMIHVAGTLRFARDRSTRLDVGLIRIQAGETATEEGFDCDAHAAGGAPGPRLHRPALEIGTPEAPIPAAVTATIRLVFFPGMDRETLPALVNCGGRWEVHGAPMSRTWVKLGAPASAGSGSGGHPVTLAEPVTGWRIGDRVIVTAGAQHEVGGSFRDARETRTEERRIAAIDGASLTLDQPLRYDHYGTGDYRSEVANLSRSVVIESANPNGVRGHTMYHRDSAGGVSYAEFRHLGKEGVLGKYALHFHLVRDSMRGSGVIGASIWDSRNRWLTIHGTDYLLVRDCVGYQSVGHGFFLEDGTEQYNVLDHNLAVQAYAGRRLPKQALPFDPNDGAGFWWANGRNTFTRNIACENDRYGFRFEIAKRSDFDPTLLLRRPDGTDERRDVRTVPFLRFEENESHSEGLYSFNFGDEPNPGVRGDRQHPFIARSLRAWATHYALRPNLQFFLMDRLDVYDAAYGVYHPDYDAHVYRDITLNRINAEPINRGHDDESIQYGSFTYDGLSMENCRPGRDPLIQLTCTSPNEGQVGHFRRLTLKNSSSRYANVVDLGGGPRNDRLEHGVAYYFHDRPGDGRVTRVVSARFPDMQRGADYHAVEGFTGRDVLAAEVAAVPFPILLDPIDDLPPATLITSVRRQNGNLVVRGVAQDNGEVAAVTVNGRAARLLSARAGVVDWEIALDPPRDQRIVAHARDRAGNEERLPHALRAD
jgi:hypothetical protein